MWSISSYRFSIWDLSYVFLFLSALNLFRLLGVTLTWQYCLLQIFWPALAVAAIYISKKCFHLVFNYFTTSITIYGGMTLGEQMHRWVLRHLTTSCQTPSQKNVYIKGELYTDDDWDEDHRTAKCTFGYGTHLLNYEGHWLLLERTLRPDINNYKMTFESLKLTTLNKNKELLDEILKLCIPKLKEPEEDLTRIFDIQDDNSGWYQSRQPCKIRKLNTVVLPQGDIEKVLADIKKFTDKEKWYIDRGIPHRRGYLLYGPPGNGKSSAIRVIAGAIKSDICVMSLSKAGLSDDKLNFLMNEAPKGSIILLEDIDAAFKSREDESATSRETNLAFEGCSSSRITFRGLLNALDGVSSMEGRIVFMTSNFADRLDPALIRPGRVDVKLLISNPNEDQLGRMFTRFYPDDEVETQAERDELVEIREKIVKKLCSLEQPASMSMIQGLYIAYADSAREALENVESYFKEQFSICSIARTPPPSMYG